MIKTYFYYFYGIIPLCGLVLVYFKFRKPKDSNQSCWKHPPSKRILQFLFCLTNILIASPLFLFVYLLWLYEEVVPTNGFAVFSLFLLVVFSFASLFRPKFTPIMILSYGLIYFSINIYRSLFVFVA